MVLIFYSDAEVVRTQTNIHRKCPWLRIFNEIRGQGAFLVAKGSDASAGQMRTQRKSLLFRRRKTEI